MVALASEFKHCQAVIENFNRGISDSFALKKVHFNMMKTETRSKEKIDAAYMLSFNFLFPGGNTTQQLGFFPPPNTVTALNIVVQCVPVPAWLGSGLASFLPQKVQSSRGGQPQGKVTGTEPAGWGATLVGGDHTWHVTTRARCCWIGQPISRGGPARRHRPRRRRAATAASAPAGAAARRPSPRAPRRWRCPRRGPAPSGRPQPTVELRRPRHTAGHSSHS